MRHSPIFGLLFALASALPDLESRQQSLPTLKLPYGTWQATKFDAVNDLYVFKNIRFAAPPVGQLRYAKTAPPAVNETLQTGAYGPACPQYVPLSVLSGMGSIGSALGGLLGDVDLGALASGAKETGEDCLFLDVYVPSKALEGKVKVPIVNWIYGGAYLMGSKEGRYDGTPFIRATGGNVIFIAANYRVGIFGFLAGSTVEKEGTPNAGLYDQRAVLEWIQKFGNLFGGDVDNVSVWGESAGAGSIVHQLTAFGGRGAGEKALFKRAVIQSPAFDAQLDRKGQLEEQFQEIATLAGCGGKGLACLRAADLKSLKAAQDKYVASMPGAKPGIGPAVDGVFVRQLPVLEMASGNVVKGIETIINSHVFDEGLIFVPGRVNDAVFDAVIKHYWGASQATIEAIRKKFPLSKYKDQKARFKELYQFQTFTCHNRFLTEGFKNKTYNLQYSRGTGIHGSDIAADFYNGAAASSMPSFLAPTAGDPTFGTFAATFQSYLTSHARTGDPNTFRDKNSIQWPLVTPGPVYTNVLHATNQGYELFVDPVTKAEDCDFWRDALAGMTNSLGLAPPGAVVPSTIGGASGNASGNF